MQGKGICAMDVFTAAVKALKDHLVGTLAEREMEIERKGEGKAAANDYSDMIHWVLTVPAIWDDAAKQFMRESAIHVSAVELKLLEHLLYHQDFCILR